MRLRHAVRPAGEHILRTVAALCLRSADSVRGPRHPLKGTRSRASRPIDDQGEDCGRRRDGSAIALGWRAHDLSVREGLGSHGPAGADQGASCRGAVYRTPVSAQGQSPGVAAEAVIGFALNAAVTPAGRPAQYRLMSPRKPFAGVAVMVYCALPPLPVAANRATNSG